MSNHWQLQFLPSSKDITLASSSAKATVMGTCYVDTEIKGYTYSNIIFGIINNPCADILLVIDFQENHEAIVIKFGGKLQPLVISNKKSDSASNCNLMQVNGHHI